MSKSKSKSKLKPKEYLLNASLLRKRIEELDLKLWWLAEAICVSPKTVTRWISEKTLRAKLENIKALATHLEVDYQELILPEKSYLRELAMPSSQMIATIDFHLLQQSFSLSNQWALLKQLLQTMNLEDIPAPKLAQIYLLLARAYFEEDKNERSIAILEKVLEILDSNHEEYLDDQSEMRRNAFKLLSQNYIWQASWKQAKKYLKEWLMVAEATGDSRHIAEVYTYMGLNYHEIGDDQNALKYYQQGLTLLSPNSDSDNRIEITLHLSNLTLFKGSLLIEIEEFEAGRKELEQVILYSHHLHDVRAVCDAHLYLVYYYLWRGDLAKAKSYYLEAQNEYQSVKYFPNPIQLHALICLEHAQGNVEAAFSILQAEVPKLTTQIWKAKLLELGIQLAPTTKAKQHCYQQALQIYQTLELSLRIKKLSRYATHLF